jgi:hypothetical protein
MRRLARALPLTLLAALATLTAACGDDDDDAPAADAGADADLPPSLHFVTPAPAAFLRESTLVRVDPGDDDGVVLVQLFLDQELIAERAFAPYVFDVDTAVFAEGEHELKAVAHDTLDQRHATSQTVTFDNTPPTIAFLGLSSTETPTQLRFDAEDNLGVAKVEVASPVAQSRTEPPFDFDFDGGCFSSGVDVVVTDRAGWTTSMIASFAVVDGCDRDCDGHPHAACGGDDCDDNAFGIHPGLFDDAFDGTDRDCDGTDGTDLDHDGVPVGPDCDDFDPGVHGARFDWKGEATGIVGQTLALAMAGDKPVVCAASPSPFAVDCAQRTGATWSHEPVVHLDGFQHTFLGATAVTDGPAVVLVKSDTGGPAVLVRQGAGWSEIARDGEADLGGDFVSLRAISALRDANGHTHAIYPATTAFFGRVVRYATDASGTWTFETAAFLDGSELPPELLLSSAGVPHMLYADGFNSPELRVTRRDETGWEILPTISFARPQAATAAFDPSGTLHVVYQPNFGTMDHATLAPGAIDWTHAPVDVTLPAAFDLDLVCAATDHCALVTHTFPPVHAEQIDGVWYGMPVIGAFVTMSRLTLDSLGHIHAAFVTESGPVQYGSSSIGVAPPHDPPADGIDRDCNGVD